MQNTQVMLQEREVYGVLKFYPHNETARQFCAIAKTKTMTMETIGIIKQMGYEIVTDRTPFQGTI